MSNTKARLEIDGKFWEFPVLSGTENEKAIDISKLRESTGYITMDNGFANTSTCQSAITFLDGEKGILHYRGFPIEELSESSSFLEVAHLLIYGSMPTSSQLSIFDQKIRSHSTLSPALKNLIANYPKNAHPMAVLSSAISALSAEHHDSLDPSNPEHVERSTIYLLAQLPTIAAAAYKASVGQPAISPRLDLDYCSNFLHMMYSTESNPITPAKELVDALNLLLILHADHEQNCSTSTVRLIGSSAANLYASISGGINALWGPLHGGANQAVMEMLEQIHQGGGDVDKYVHLAKDKTSDFRLMGFGHRVYKNFDPRASIIKKACDKVLTNLGVDNPLLNIAKQLEAAALSDPYFKEKKLYPNVDFYSGIIYSAMNIPVDMFTVMFAFGRLPGWLAHWKEMHATGAKIGRPRQIYSGPTPQQRQKKVA